MQSKDLSVSGCDAVEQTIRQLAYDKWQRAGSPHGDGVNFWFEAENELFPCVELEQTEEEEETECTRPVCCRNQQ
jgi:hypothetical protein